ncbi:helix-turn-helix domain-containing protein [Brenneria tiliae]|uniref:helix-turn-helix domain-containing protein n=1 Tax=Brenneria tiliae TaxID=2914984 RepID=UPI002014C7CA|nr:helix-turn-helix domain-containing protein [Brenneria tiliae]MCL2899292.1 helix-turn-helix domain-containing protein [Brenneria tiliae]MCL2903670.1 helix-turn-helix domain-containing protein [Brenneria tiliae]
MTHITFTHDDKSNAASAESMINAFAQAVKNIPLLNGVYSESEYKNALALIEYMIDRDDLENPLFEPLAAKIAEYESTAPEFAAMNLRLDNIQNGVAVVRTIMDQYGLKAADLAAELGSKSNVSNILSGRRALTVQHIKALSLRFNVPADAFI